MIIGLVGTIACGKGVVADYLIKKYGYTSFSLSSIVHDEVKRRGITNFTRTTLQDIGDELRRGEGDGVLAKRAIDQLNRSSLLNQLNRQKIIIEGIRNPGEVEYLRSIPGFFLIAVDADQKIRYQRVLKRGKQWDPKYWESFLKIDERDSSDGENTNGQQVRKCMEMAEVKIENNDGIEELIKKLEPALQ